MQHLVETIEKLEVVHFNPGSQEPHLRLPRPEKFHHSILPDHSYCILGQASISMQHSALPDLSSPPSIQ